MFYCYGWVRWVVMKDQMSLWAAYNSRDYRKHLSDNVQIALLEREKSFTRIRKYRKWSVSLEYITTIKNDDSDAVVVMKRSNVRGAKGISQYNYILMERRVRWKSHARCGSGEKIEIISKSYLSTSLALAADAAREGDNTKCAMYVENIAEVFFPVDGADDPVWPNAWFDFFEMGMYNHPQAMTSLRHSSWRLATKFWLYWNKLTQLKILWTDNSIFGMIG